MWPGGWLVHTTSAHGNGWLLRAELEKFRIKWKEVVSEEGCKYETSAVPLGTCGDLNIKCMSNAKNNAIHELARKTKP